MAKVLDYGYCKVADRAHNDSDLYLDRKMLSTNFFFRCRYCNEKVTQTVREV